MLCELENDLILVGKCNRADNKILQALEEKGYHPINNPFFNAPFGNDNHIYNSPVDLMHTFLCGIIKSILQWTLIIVGEIRLHVDVKQSTPFSQNQGLLDQRLREFPNVPDVPHLYWNTFKSGLTYIHIQMLQEQVEGFGLVTIFLP